VPVSWQIKNKIDCYSDSNDYPVGMDTMPTITLGVDDKIFRIQGAGNRQIPGKFSYRQLKKRGRSHHVYNF
jgi:hypothetical protein